MCAFREKLLFVLGILAHKVPGIRRVVSKYASNSNVRSWYYLLTFWCISFLCFQKWFSKVILFDVILKHLQLIVEFVLYESKCLRPTERSAKRILAIVILSVRLSVTTWYRFKPRWYRDSRFSLHDSVESLVRWDQLSWRWVRRFPLNEGTKEGYPLRNHYFTTINSPSVITVGDRCRPAAYHKKHCWWPFQVYQHQWPWTTWKLKNSGFLVNFSWFQAAAHM